MMSNRQHNSNTHCETFTLIHSIATFSSVQSNITENKKTSLCQVQSIKWFVHSVDAGMHEATSDNTSNNAMKCRCIKMVKR